MTTFQVDTIDTVRLGNRDRKRLFEYVEAGTVAVAQDNDKRNLRLDMNIGQITFELINANEEVTRFSVIPRNISNRGLAFMHGQYLHNKSRCAVILPQINDDRPYRIEGYLSRSRHIKGLIHEVVMLFDHPIDLSRFVKLTPTQMNKNLRDRGNDKAGHVIVALFDKQGKPVKFAIVPKVLDATTLSFHHGLKLATGSPCMVGLPCKDGTNIRTLATITTCKTVQEHVHVISMTFEKPIDCTRVLSHLEDRIETTDMLKRALIVDDESAFRNLLSMRLKQMKIDSIQASTSAQAYQLLETEKVDVILLDIYLDKERGFDISQKLRNMGYQGPIVAMSSDNRLQTEGHSLASGCNAFLHKPFRPQDLAQTMSSLTKFNMEKSCNINDQPTESPAEATES